MIGLSKFLTLLCLLSCGYGEVCKNFGAFSPNQSNQEVIHRVTLLAQTEPAPEIVKQAIIETRANFGLIEAMLNIIAQSQPEAYDKCRLIAQVYAPDAFTPFAGEPSETKAAEVKTVKVLYDIYGNIIGRVEQKADGRLAIYNENGQQLGFLVKPEQETVGVLAASLKFNQHYILKLEDGVQVSDIFGATPVDINERGEITLRVTDMLHFIPIQRADFFYETTLFAGVIIMMPPPSADAASKAAAANSSGGAASPFASIAGSVQGAASSASAGDPTVNGSQDDDGGEPPYTSTL